MPLHPGSWCTELGQFLVSAGNVEDCEYGAGGGGVAEADGTFPNPGLRVPFESDGMPLGEVLGK